MTPLSFCGALRCWRIGASLAMKKMLTLIPYTLVLVLMAGAQGCVRLEKSYPEIQTYGLNVPVPDQGHLTASSARFSVKLNDFTVGPGFADRYLAYRTAETAYETDFYHQFMAAPSAIIQEECAEWLKNSPLIQFIAGPSLKEAPDYSIEGKVLELYGDYRNEKTPRAVMKIEFTVSQDSVLVLQQTYSAEVPMDRPSPGLLTEAWGKGLGRILTGFETDFKNVTP